MNTNKKNPSRIDYGLILTIMLLALISFITLSSAQSTGQYKVNFVVEQAKWYFISIMAIGLFMQLDAEQMRKVSKYIYLIGAICLIVLLVAPATKFTPVRNGAQLWFVFPGIGQIQPSEFMKIATIMYTSNIIVNHHEKYIVKTVKSDVILLIKQCMAIGLPIALLIKEDLGTALVFMAIALGMIVVSGVTWKLLFPLLSSFTLLAGTVFYLAIWQRPLMEKIGVENYQFLRLDSWLDPYSYRQGAGMHLVNSLEAIGSGMTTGKGFGNREVYIPESHTDFIFSTIGEEFGFIGGSILISVFFLLIYQITRRGLDTKIPFYTYFCVGFIASISFHVFQNIGMTIQLLPITGIPLPFISYGGSSLLSTMLGVGVLLSIRYHYKVYMFSSEEDEQLKEYQKRSRS